jgi:hypothetical protein
MPEANLDTTNLLLGMMAAVSALETLFFASSGSWRTKLYREAMPAVYVFEERQVAPLRLRMRTARSS